jgi:hypothetical protein
MIGLKLSFRRLAEEWMTPEEVTKNRAQGQVQELRQGRKLYHEVSSKPSCPTDQQTLTPPKVPPVLPPSPHPPPSDDPPITRKKTPSKLDNWAGAPPPALASP